MATTPASHHAMTGQRVGHQVGSPSKLLLFERSPNLTGRNTKTSKTVTDALRGPHRQTRRYRERGLIRQRSKGEVT
jgi:hypothetical protein